MTQDRWPRGTPIAPSGRGPGGGRFRGESVFATFVDPNLGGPSEHAKQFAQQWAHEHFDYRDRSTGYDSRVVEVEHHGDGFKVYGGFYDAGTGVGEWEFTLFHDDEDGRDKATVESIHIKPDRRGEGLGKRWVQRLEEAAAAQGATEINMWDMSGGFWESRGYVRDRRGESRKTLQPPTDWASIISGRIDGLG